MTHELDGQYLHCSLTGKNCTPDLGLGNIHKQQGGKGFSLCYTNYWGVGKTAILPDIGWGDQFFV